MNVLYVDNSDWWGGAEACLLAYLQQQLELGWKVRLLAKFPSQHLGPYQEVLSENLIYRSSKMPYWSIEKRGARFKGHDRISKHLYAKRLAAHLESLQPEVVYFNLHRFRDTWDMEVARRAGCKVVVHVRHLAHQGPLKRAVLDQADLIICMSEITRNQALDSGTSTQVVRVYDGVGSGESMRLDRDQLRLELGVTESDVVFAFPAVLEPRKGQDLAIGVWANIVEQNPTAMLLIAGGSPKQFGEYADHCRRLAARVSSADRIRFLGHQSNVDRVYAAADVVLALSNDGEAYGRVPVEAANLGCPVIATDAGATPELICDGQTGLLIEPRNESQLHDAVVRLMDPSERQRMGTRAKSHVRKEFSLQTGLDQIADHLLKLVEKS